MAEKNEPLDVAQLARRDLTETAFPGGGKQNFRIFFDPKIHKRIADHAAEKLSLEICGVLVGQWHRDADGPFVLVDETIRCDKAVSNAGDVTLTHEDWNDVNREMDTKFTDRAIVGWYHSHPNFGIFLSERDLFIQEYTFNGPGHDRLRGRSGQRRRGGLRLARRQGEALPALLGRRRDPSLPQGAGRKPSSASPAGKSPACRAQARWPCRRCRRR